MAPSSQLASFILLHTLIIGASIEPVGEFVIGDRKFAHVWHTKQSMPSKHSDMSATTVDDAIYLVGGCKQDQVWVSAPYPEYACGGSHSADSISVSTFKYSPASNTFETLTNAPRPRYRHAAAVVDKSIYVFGGTGATGSIVPEVDVFNTATGQWTTRSQTMPGATTDLAAFAYSGKIYVVGGYDASWNALTTTQMFDPAAPDDSSAWQPGPSLQQGRGDIVAVLVDSQAFIVGGFHHENNFEMPVSSMEMLNVGQGGAWVTKNSMNVARGDKAVASLNGILHVIGGETKNSNSTSEHWGHSVPLVDVEAYDPIGDAWYYGGDIPSSRFRFTAASHGNSIFIFGGQGYLVGNYETDGSYYPLVGTVEEYYESISPAAVSKASSMLSLCSIAGLSMSFMLAYR